MTPAQAAMSTWVGALVRSGVVDDDPDVAAGEAVAAYVVGEDALFDLRRFFAEESAEVTVRERRAAIEVCIWMAHADREIHPEERYLLAKLVGRSGLDSDTQDELVAAVHEPPPLEGIEARLTQPVLRELMLALAWELALADGRVDEAESAFYGELARRLGIDPARADELRDAVSERLG